MNRISPIGCGYDYFATPTSFLARLKQRPILDVTDKSVISNESKISLIVDTQASISNLFTSFDIQNVKGGQYKIFPACVSGKFKLTQESINEPIYECKNFKFINRKLTYLPQKRIVGYEKIEPNKDNYVYTHLIIVHQKSRHTFNGTISESLNPIFAQDLQGSVDALGNTTLMSPLELREKYGTHVLTDAVMGGLIELFIVTVKRKDESYTDVKKAIESAFLAITQNNGNSANWEEMKKLSNRSTLTCKQIGGEPCAMSDFSEFITNYTKWANSLNDTQNQEFCGYYEGDFSTSCVPLSNLSTSEERKAAIKNQFDNELHYSNPISGPTLHSDLSNPVYRNNNNDMVTALTQYSINQTLKSYIKKGYQIGDTKLPEITIYILEQLRETSDNKERILFYVFPDTDVEKELPSEFPEELRCKDLYDKINALGLNLIASDKGKPTDKEMLLLQEAKEKYCFCCAIFGELGFPVCFTQDDIAEFKPIVLDTNNPGAVHYTQCFKELRIIEIQADQTVTIYSQEKDKEAWLFQYDMNLKLDKVNTLSSEKDENVKQEILRHFNLIDLKTDLKELGQAELKKLYNKMDEMYTISKLYLNLDTPSFTSTESVSLHDGNRAFLIASEVIPHILKQNLQNNLVLGRTFTENRSRDKQYAVIPLEYKLSVKPSPDSDDDDLSTLNYVINLDGDDNHNPLVPQPFNWHWVGKGRKRLQSGTTAINHQTLFTIVLTKFEESVTKNLCLQAKAKINGNIVGQLDWITELKKSTSPNSLHFQYNEQEKSYIYGNNPTQEWGWTSRDEQGTKSVLVPPLLGATCGLKLHYYMSSKASWGNTTVNRESLPAIFLDTTVKTYLNLAWNGSHNDGFVYHHHLRCILALNTDEQGKVNVIPIVEDQAQPTTFNKGQWTKPDALNIDNILNNVINMSKNAVSNALNQFKSTFTDAFSIGAEWVLPGNGRFIFTNSRFTESGDLAFDINYFEAD